MVYRFGLLLVIAVLSSGSSYGQVADRIYRGGDIVTVNDAQPFAEAVAMKDGKILAVGSNDKIAKLQDAKTEIIDLAGGALLPGFVDGQLADLKVLHTIKAGKSIYTAP